MGTELVLLTARSQSGSQFVHQSRMNHEQWDVSSIVQLGGDLRADPVHVGEIIALGWFGKTVSPKRWMGWSEHGRSKELFLNCILWDLDPGKQSIMDG